MYSAESLPSVEGGNDPCLSLLRCPAWQWDREKGKGRGTFTPAIEVKSMAGQMPLLKSVFPVFRVQLVITSA